MMLSHNLDRTDEALNTKAPFTTDSNLSALGVPIPSASLIAVELDVKIKHALPVHLSSVSLADTLKSLSIVFSDSESEAVASARIPVSWQDGLELSSRVLLDEFGAVCGHMAFTRDFLAAISSACLLSSTKEVLVKPEDLVLLPSCLHIDMREGVRQIAIGGDTSVGAVSLNTEGGLQVVKDGEVATVTRMDRFDVPVRFYSETNTIKAGVDGAGEVAVQEGDNEEDLFSAYDRSLVIKAGVKSNVRVSDVSGGIVIGGVKDE